MVHLLLKQIIVPFLSGIVISTFIFFIGVSLWLERPVELNTHALADPVKSVNGWFGEGGSPVDVEWKGEDLVDAFNVWDQKVGCDRFRRALPRLRPAESLQDPSALNCSSLTKSHVAVLVKSSTWIPDSLNALYPCSCGLTCLWTKSSTINDQPDAHLYEGQRPPQQRYSGEPLRVLLDLEAPRSRANQDIFVSYHAEDDVQATYAGIAFHPGRNHYVSSQKHRDILVYWSSSRCLKNRNDIAQSFLPLVPHHSFGKCLNNVGGGDALLEMYPVCAEGGGGTTWYRNLHCAMSHYKFVLAIENTRTDSYVTEKLFYALDVGSVPIYFGAPNVLDFVPPKSIILGSDFHSMEALAAYVRKLARDPVLYAEYHAWRRCGIVGYYNLTRAVSIDTLPCRLCAAVSRMGGKNAPI